MRLALVILLAAVAIALAFEAGAVKTAFENLLNWLSAHRLEGAFIMVQFAVIC